MYRRVRVRCAEDPPDNFMRINGSLVTVNPIRQWWQKEQDKMKRKEEQEAKTVTF